MSRQIVAKEHWIYLARDGRRRILKLGMTGDIEQRLKAYTRKRDGMHIVRLWSLGVGVVYEARSVERDIHARLAERFRLRFRYSREWYRNANTHVVSGIVGKVLRERQRNPQDVAALLRGRGISEIVTYRHVVNLEESSPSKAPKARVAA
jgi:hypothetical protein